MDSMKSATLARWQLQNEAVGEMPDEVCQKTTEALLGDSWRPLVIKYLVSGEPEAAFARQYLEWAFRVGKIAVGDEVAPYTSITKVGAVRRGIAIWRHIIEDEDYEENQTVVE